MEQKNSKKYAHAFRHGPPRHALYDDFSLRHPKMPPGQRAKIFSPFAALRGFEEAIDEKVVPYVEKRDLNEEEQDAINRTIAQLYAHAGNRRLARENRVIATALYYVPCQDENHEAYGLRGSYQAVTGRVWQVDPVLTKTLTIGEETLEFSDIAELTIMIIGHSEEEK